MSFLATWAFGFLAVLPVIVLLYLLRIRRKAAPVSTLLFWQRVLEQSRRRALFQRLRNLLSLLLHLLIFLLILLALARPEWKRFLPAGGSTVIVLDARARMQSIEDGRSRFDRARERALALVRHASALDEMAVIAGHASPEIVAPFTSDDAALRRAIVAMQPTSASGDLRDSLALARQILASRSGTGRILVLTPEAVEEKNVTVIPVGTAQDNVAITTFAARPLPNSPLTSGVFLEVRNLGGTKASGSVEITLDGKLLDVRPFELETNDIFTANFEIAPDLVSGPGWLKARIDRDDALPLDNTAFATVANAEPIRVLLVSKSDWFLENLLRADERVQFELLSPTDFRSEMAAAFDVVIADNLVPEGFETAGNWLFLGVSPFGASDAVIERPVVTGEESGSPLLRLAEFRDILFIQSRALAAPPPDWIATIPLESAGSALAITAERKREGSRQRVAAFGFTTADSDLPLRIAFPLLMSNTIQWLAGGATTEPLAARAGETFTPPAGARAATMPGESAPADASTFIPLENGFYRVSENGRDRWLAVNTFSAAESDLRAPPGAPASISRFSPATAALWPLWYYLALAALVLFTLEWFLFHRRRTE